MHYFLAVVKNLAWLVEGLHTRRVVFCPICQSDKINVSKVTRNYGEFLTLDAACNTIALPLR